MALKTTQPKEDSQGKMRGASVAGLLPKEGRVLQQEFQRRRQAAFRRHPLLFTLLGTFGLVATLYGFERVIDRIPFLAGNPIVLLLVGIGTLALTGTLYRYLSA